MRNFLRFVALLVVLVAAFLLSGLLFYGQCDAQAADPQKSLTIFGFKGLNTAEGLFVATPDYARVCNNVDFSRNGSPIISKRWGFDTVRTVTKRDSSGTLVSARIDSIVGLGTYQRSNRQACLVYAVDDSTNGYGAIYATKYGSDNPDSATKIKDYWSIQNPTRFSQFNDNLYAANGQQQGMVWDGTRVRNFPVNTPGMFDIIPLNTSGNLNGEYRYCIYTVAIYSGVSSYVIAAGNLSPPIYVKNGKVLLRSFARAITDSIITSADSAFAYIGRTKANPGPIDDADTIWRLGDIPNKVWLKYGADYVADTVTFTDNTTDASLTAKLTLGEIRARYGRDSARFITGRRFGAPTFISSDTANTTKWRITFGAAENAGYAYMVTVADTLSGLESDSSRVLFVGQKRYADSDSAKTAKRFTIGLPRTNLLDSSYVMNVYRASQRITVRPFIVVASTRPGGDTIFTVDEPGKFLGVPFYNGRVVVARGVSTDSALTVDFYLAGTVPLSQTTFVDSIRCDSLWLRGKRFNLSTQPEIFSQILQWKSRLGGVASSRIWFSSMFVDSQGNFGTNDFDDFNRNDGDFITAVSERQFGLVVKKNRSSYVLPNGGGRPEKTKATGCVAPLSYVTTDVGDLYVGDGGVYLETEGDALERVYNSGLTSEKLKNFLDMPDSVRRRIAGFWLPQSRQVILSADYPATSNDTAFVLDFRAGQAWSTWTNLVPKFGVLYSKNSTLGSPPPQTFYFTKAGGKTIYTYATNNKDDNGNYPAITYQTVPLFPDRGLEQVDEVGIVHTSTSYGDLCIVDAVNERDSAICSQKAFDSLGLRYVYKELGAVPSVASGIRITTGTLGSTTFSNGIEAIEVFYRRAGKVGAR